MMAHTLNLLRRIPFRMHWFVVLLTGLVIPCLTRNHPDPKQRGEWYPFSNFPMYSTFEPTAYYVYVTDLEDKPLPLVPTFGNWGSGVKKTYDQFLKAEVRRLKDEAKQRGERYSTRIAQMTSAECRPAGDATLKQLRDSSKHQDVTSRYPGFRLYQVDITLDGGRIAQRAKLVGEVKG